MARIFNRHPHKKTRQHLRNNMPHCEGILWSRLKNRQVHDYKFRRQYGVGPYVLDFYCPALKLAIEVDGNSHFGNGAEKKDAHRQAYIESMGLQMLRFTNNDIRSHLDVVMDRIDDMVIDLAAKNPP